jgi:hypothetical protein
MRFQVTIGQLLFATAAFALTLGCFAPFDTLSLWVAIPISCTVFAFVLTMRFPRSAVGARQYASRQQATLAGMRRGAIFGGKFMGIVVGVSALVFWISFSAMAVFRWLWYAESVLNGLNKENVAIKGAYATVMFLAVPTIFAAVACAFIMAVQGAVNFGAHTAQSEAEAPLRSETSQDGSKSSPPEE